MRRVPITSTVWYMWYICEYYTMRFLNMFCIGNFVIYFFLFRGDISTAPQIHLRFYWYVCVSYNGVCIDMFVYVIQYNCWLYCILDIFPTSILFMGYSATASLLHLHLCQYVCECYIYVQCDISLYFIWSTPRLYSILGIMSYIFTVYVLLCHFRHPRWP